LADEERDNGVLIVVSWQISTRFLDDLVELCGHFVV
jgi:hypothetical protein